MDKAAAVEAARIKAAGVMTPEALVALSKDKVTLDAGQGRSSRRRASHATVPDGGGVVGPNLTDDFWIHGGAPDKVLKTISAGVPDKGMPAWGPQLGADKVRAVTAYVISLRGTNVAEWQGAAGRARRRLDPKVT